jgi:hypothetical protein
VNPSGPQPGQPWSPQPGDASAQGGPRADPPPTVSLAFVLLTTAAVLGLLPLVPLVYELTHFEGVLRRAAERTMASPHEVSQERIANRIVTGVGIVTVLLTSAALFVPALWLRRGSPVARVLSCISGVGAAFCCCGGYGLSLAGQSPPTGTDLQQEVSRLSAQETPAWVGLSGLPAVLIAPFAITAVVLLLLPPSNRYFYRRPAPEAGQPYGEYYGYPGPWWGGQPTGQPDKPDQRDSPPDKPDEPPDSPPRD